MELYYGEHKDVGFIAVGISMYYTTGYSCLGAGIGTVIGTALGNPIAGAKYGAMSGGVVGAGFSYYADVSLIIPTILTLGATFGATRGAIYASQKALNFPYAMAGSIIGTVASVALPIASAAAISKALEHTGIIDYFLDNKDSSKLSDSKDSATTEEQTVKPVGVNIDTDNHEEL